MKSFRTSFDKLRLDKGTGEMMAALQRGLQRFGVDYYLVGAISRNVWMSVLHNVVPRRTTTDIDFAVFINDRGIYESLKEYLVNEEGFTSYRENAFVLIWKNGLQVDLLPFGAIEDEHRRVTVEGTGYTSVHVPGFKEVYEEALPQVEIDEHAFKCCTLPGIVLLKLIAWEDRPEVRSDDIKDIADILQHFFDMYQEWIYTEHLDLFEAEELELIEIAAIVLGRELKKIAIRDASLYNRIGTILETNSASAATSKMAIIMTEYFGNTAEDNLKLIIAIRRGYLEAEIYR